MRKQTGKIAMLTLLVAFAVSTAGAQVDIGLGPTGNPPDGAGTVTFTGTGSGTAALSFGTCTAGTNCWSGSTTGTAGVTSLTGDFWSINFTGTSPVLDQSTNLISGAAAAFSIGSAVGGSDLLTGNLSLVSLGQVGNSGVFNDNLVANLTVTGGTLAPDFFNGTGVTQIVIRFTSTGNVDLLGSGATLSANQPAGTLTSTPEPSSLLLMGSGLMVCGGVLRRKLLSKV